MAGNTPVLRFRFALLVLPLLTATISSYTYEFHITFTHNSYCLFAFGCVSNEWVAYYIQSVSLSKCHWCRLHRRRQQRKTEEKWRTKHDGDYNVDDNGQRQWKVCGNMMYVIRQEHSEFRLDSLHTKGKRPPPLTTAHSHLPPFHSLQYAPFNANPPNVWLSQQQEWMFCFPFHRIIRIIWMCLVLLRGTLIQSYGTNVKIKFWPKRRTAHIPFDRIKNSSFFLHELI